MYTCIDSGKPLSTDVIKGMETADVTLPQPKGARQQLLAQLRSIAARAPLHASGKGVADFIPTGIPSLDDLLPDEGLRWGSLTEWLADSEGMGTATLALLAVAPALRQGGELVVIDPERTFYPPAAAGLGIDLERTLIVQPATMPEALWAFEQALRCSGVCVTLGRFERLSNSAGRRLQLAAEEGSGLGLLLRPARVRGQASWADLRLQVHAVPSSRPSPVDSLKRRFRIELLRCRNGTGQGAVTVELHHDTGLVRLVSELADPAPGARAAGA